MQYFYTKPKNGPGTIIVGTANDANITAVIRANFTSTSLLQDIVAYATVRDETAYGAEESHWDMAVAFDLYPCVEFDGKEFITIHEPAQDSE
jgi:hypothetical protein